MLTGPLCKAARALVEWPRKHLAKVSGVDARAIEKFEARLDDLPDPAKDRLHQALESAGAVFIPENGGGVGVRLRYSQRDVLDINEWEGEGGPPGDDDV